MPSTLGVIGLGRMAQALLLPLLKRGDFLPEEIFGVVGHQKSIQSVLDKFPPGLRLVSPEDSMLEEVWNAPIKILAIKPQQLKAVAIQAQKYENKKLSSKPLLISLLAGVSLEHLLSTFPNHNCVRAVPNVPALVSAGLTGLACSDGITSNQRTSVEAIFQPISEVFELPENQLDAFLALTSSGPAYVALMAEGLSDGAVAAGLPRKLSNQLAYKMLYGSALLLKEREDLHPGQLKDMVASPGGTTINALRHLEKAGVRSALMEAVVAAAERSRELN